MWSYPLQERPNTELHSSLPSRASGFATSPPPSVTYDRPRSSCATTNLPSGLPQPPSNRKNQRVHALLLTPAMGERRELGAGGWRCAIFRWHVMHAIVVVYRLGVTLVPDVVRMVVSWWRSLPGWAYQLNVWWWTGPIWFYREANWKGVLNILQTS
jgi:hypothetical protein